MPKKEKPERQRTRQERADILSRMRRIMVGSSARERRAMVERLGLQDSAESARQSGLALGSAVTTAVPEDREAIMGWLRELSRQRQAREAQQQLRRHSGRLSRPELSERAEQARTSGAESRRQLPTPSPPGLGESLREAIVMPGHRQRLAEVRAASERAREGIPREEATVPGMAAVPGVGSERATRTRQPARRQAPDPGARTALLTRMGEAREGRLQRDRADQVEEWLNQQDPREVALRNAQGTLAHPTISLSQRAGDMGADYGMPGRSTEGHTLDQRGRWLRSLIGR